MSEEPSHYIFSYNRVGVKYRGDGIGVCQSQRPNIVELKPQCVDRTGIVTGILSSLSHLILCSPEEYYDIYS